MKRAALFFAIVCLIPISAWADDTPIKHTCIQPDKGPGLVSTIELNKFAADAKAYRECIQAFVDGQQAAIKAHEKAALQAAEEYNKFADKELIKSK